MVIDRFVKKVTWPFGSSQHTSVWARPWAPPKKNLGSACGMTESTPLWQFRRPIQLHLKKISK